MQLKVQRRWLRYVLYFLFFFAFQWYFFGRVSYRAAKREQQALTANLFRFTRTPNVSLECSRLLLLIFSVPSESDRRYAIRDTWANSKRLAAAGAARVFVIGGQTYSHSLDAEQREFGDILTDEQLNESYFNLTRKTVSSLHWVSTQSWKQMRYIAKIDSDNFVNVNVLNHIADMLWTSNGTLWMTGYSVFGKGPIRDKNSKWYISEEEYPRSDYPTYLNGPHYMMTLESARKVVGMQTLLEIARGRALRIEDVYITGIVRERLHIPLIHKGFPIFIIYIPSVSEVLTYLHTFVFAALHGPKIYSHHQEIQKKVDSPEVHQMYYEFLSK